LLTILNVINANASESVTLLEKGDPAPYRGLLFDEEYSNQLYKDLETLRQNLASVEKINALYRNNEELYETKINVLLSQNTKLTTSLMDSEKNREINNVIWFAAGISAVVLGAYATQAISK
jgi:hypothetical protein